MALLRDDYELVLSIESKLNSIKKMSQEGYVFSESDIEKVNKLKGKLEEIENDISKIKKESNLNDFQFNEYIKYKKELAEVEEMIQAAVSAGVDNMSNQSYVENKTKKALLENKINAIENSNTQLITNNTYQNYSQQVEELSQIDTTLYNISISNNKIIRENKEWNEQINNLKQGYSEFIGGIQKSFSIIKNTTKFWREQDEELTKMVSTFGLTQSEFEKYRKASYKTGVDMAKSYNRTQVDMVKMQQGYAEMTGKNIILTKENYDSQFQLAQLMGDDNSLAFTSGIEQFGIGIDDARDKLYDIYKINTKNGVSWAKTSKDLVSNLKLAQKYNFKGGLNNMMEMTVWANKMKVNLQTIGTIADKISNPEGVIETASKLQVLGGQFATMSNPFQMLYESLEDIGGLAQRVEKMFNNIGTFDKNLGQVTISGPDRIRIKAAADAMGMAYDEAIEIINNRARRNEIEKQIKFNSDLSDESKEFLKTIAQWNSKTKSFEVRTFNEDKKTFENRNINSLSDEDIKKLSQEPDEDIKKLVERTFSIDKKIERINTTIEAQKAEYLDKYKDGIGELATDATNILANTEWIAQILLGISAFMVGLNLYKSIKGVGKMAKGSKGLKGAIYSGLPRNKETGRIDKKLIAKRAVGTSIGGAIIGGAVSYAEGSVDVNTLKKEREELIRTGKIAPGSKTDKEYQERINHAEKQRTGQAIGSAIGTGVGSLLYLIPYVGGVAGTAGSIGGGILGGDIGSSIVGDYESVDDGAVLKNKVIKANNKDSAIFAKENGPFDKLFGEIIPKIDYMHSSMKNMLKMPFLSQISNDNIENNNMYYEGAKYSKIENMPNTYFNSQTYKIGNFNKSYSENSFLNSKNSNFDYKNNNINNDSKYYNDYLNSRKTIISNYNDFINKKLENTYSFVKNTKNELNKTFESKYDELYSNYESIIENRINKSYKNNVKPFENKIIDIKPIGDEKEIINEYKNYNSTSSANVSNENITIKPIDININGTLKMDFDGRNINIIDELRNNPILLREISKLLTNEISSSINGGRPKLDKNRFAKV